MRASGALGLLVLVVAVAGCQYKAPAPEASISCGPGGGCPGGQMCVALDRPDGGQARVCCREKTCGGRVTLDRPDAGGGAIDAVVDLPGDPTPPDQGEAAELCPPDFRSCAGKCISEKLCCKDEDCPAVEGAGTVQCVANACVRVCGPGTHKCDDACVSNNAPATCGTSCNTPCVAPSGGGSVTCDGTQCVPQCPTGTKLCHGACVGESFVCPACDPGYHDCQGTCRKDDSPESCGRMCTPCPAPPNGSPTCTGGACGFACNANFKVCGTECIKEDACCTAADCSGGPTGAVPACADRQCSFTCPAGTHLCGMACVSNEDPATCGMSCNEPCPTPAGGRAVCRAGSCDVACDPPLRACGDRCIGTDEPCMDVCNAGRHRCADRCVSNDSVNSCGPTSCEPCPVPPNATATCAGGVCGFVCSAGYKPCGNRCILNEQCCSDAECTAVPTGGAGRCTGNVCEYVCHQPGTHRCGQTCASDTSPATCGASCTPCPPAPPNTMPGCDGVRCTYPCIANHKRCGSTPGCVPMSDCCSDADCAGRPPMGSTPRCDVASGRCTNACPANTHDCGGTCVSNLAPATCGASCTPCPTGHGCNGTMCVIDCTGRKPCGSGCIDLTACCTPAECMAPANATATCTNNACGFDCNRDYFRDGAACINERQVPCDPNNNNPPNSEDVARTVTIRYSTAGGWTAPAACAWACNVGFRPVNGTCVSSQPIYIYRLPLTTGNLGGRAGANMRCAAGVPTPIAAEVTQQVALLGAGPDDGIRDMPARYGVPTDREILSVSRRRLAQNWADFTDYSIAISLADADVLPRGSSWWSGTYPPSDLFPPFTAGDANCAAWTDMGSQGGHTGHADATDRRWVHRSGEFCRLSYHVLCLAWR